jgi:hypothetical protein
MTHSDALLWALLIDEFRSAGAATADAERLARRAVAIVRRTRSGSGADRTFGPGDTVPYHVTEVYDLDGDVWERQGDPERDTWRMRGYDPAEHESRAGDAWLTSDLVEEYGPLTDAEEPPLDTVI